jgi:hypothetical protein
VPGLQQPYETIWGGAAPVFTDTGSSPIIYCNRVQFLVAGRVFGISYWYDTNDTGNHLGWMRKIGQGTVFVSKVFPRYLMAGSHGSRWETKYFTPALHVAALDVFQTVMIHSFGHHSEVVGPHSGDTDTTIGHFKIPADAGVAPNGAFSTALTFNPASSAGAAKYAIDVRFLPD